MGMVLRTAMAGALSLLSACGLNTIDDLHIERWVGRPADELVRSWGPPEESYVLSDGSRTLQYRQLDFPSSGRRFSYGSVRECAIRFDADPSGVVTGARRLGSLSCGNRLGYQDPYDQTIYP